MKEHAMHPVRRTRQALTLCAVAAVSACASQGQIVAPWVMANSSSAQAAHGSWMKPGTSSGDLLYLAASASSSPGVSVLSYPGGTLVGQLDVSAQQLCSDPKGNVFLTQSTRTGSTSTILEYAHGGTKPIAKLRDAYNGAFGCSVDPATENLAVANYGGDGTVVVYAGAKGTPKVYHLWFEAQFCGYDNASNLFAIGHTIHTNVAEISPTGGVHKIKLYTHVPDLPMGIQWDGRYLAIGEATNVYNRGKIFQYAIQGRSGISKGTTPFDTTAESFFIDGSTVILSTFRSNLDFFDYPAGGSPTKMLPGYGDSAGITVSLAPSRSRTRR